MKRDKVEQSFLSKKQHDGNTQVLYLIKQLQHDRQNIWMSFIYLNKSTKIHLQKESFVFLLKQNDM